MHSHIPTEVFERLKLYQCHFVYHKSHMDHLVIPFKIACF